MTVTPSSGTFKTRKTTCEFFRVLYGTGKNDGSVLLTDIVDELHKNCATVQERNHVDGEDVYRMYDYTKTTFGCRGSLLRLRIGAVAQKAAIDRDAVEDIPLNEGEHLVETLTFLYFKESSVVVLQRNRDVGGPNTLASYIRNKGGYLALTFQAIFNSDAMKRLKGLRKIKRAEFKITVPPRNLFDSLSGTAVEEFLELGRHSHSATITIVLSSGHRRQFLSAEYVKEFASDTMSVLGVGKKGGVKVAKVTGAANEISPDQMIDLIADKVCEPVDVNYVGSEPTIHDYYNALNHAYNVRRNELYIPDQTDGKSHDKNQSPTPKAPS
jgi:hypothetical protein